MNRHGSSLITPASQFFDSDREKSPLKPRIAAVPIVTQPPALDLAIAPDALENRMVRQFRDQLVAGFDIGGR